MRVGYKNLKNVLVAIFLGVLFVKISVYRE